MLEVHALLTSFYRSSADVIMASRPSVRL